MANDDPALMSALTELTELPAGRERALLRTVRELEQHVSADGWDGPIRLFALIRTAQAIERNPGLADQLPNEVVAAAGQDPDHLTAVEQEGLPEAGGIEELLGQVTWPSTVDGAAIVVERIVVPPEAEAGLPADEQAALDQLQNHPRRRDLRLAAAVLREGTQACAIRARDQDSDDRVAVGTELVPGLTAALADTLADTLLESPDDLV